MPGRLTIARSEALYRLPQGHHDPAAARLRLDRLIEREVPRVLGSLVGGVLADDDPSVWMIRSLDADFTCDLAAVDDWRLSRAWAAAVGSSLLTAMRRGPQGDAVLHYRDRAAYLAEFLTDLAAGRAWDRWQYESFDTLRSLPTSSALAEALLREPGEIAAVLARLAAERRLEPVLVALTEPAAARVAAALLAAAGAGGGTADPEIIRLCAERLAASGVAPAPARARLRLLAALAGEAPQLLAAPDLAPSLAVAEGLLELGAHAPALVTAATAGIGEAIRVLRRLNRRQRIEALHALRELARRQPKALHELAAEVARRAGAPLGAGPVLLLDSPSACLFFLLPSYLALAFETRWDELAAGGLLSERERPLLRYRVLARALGRDPASRGTADEVLRLVCGLGQPDPSGVYPLPARSSEVAAALDEAGVTDLEQATSAAAHRLLRHFALRLPGFGQASDAHLIRNFLTGTGQVRVTPAAIDVDLPPLPLAVVARMAGADGLTYELPWLARTVTVRCRSG